MALVKELKPMTKERYDLHAPVECRFCVFTDERGDRILQLDTYGSRTRKIPGKVSQSLQFNADSARQLLQIIQKEF